MPRKRYLVAPEHQFSDKDHGILPSFSNQILSKFFVHVPNRDG